MANAREAILEKFPDQRPENLRLNSIIDLDHSTDHSRKYMVSFEALDSIHVTTNNGVRTRSVRNLTAHIADDGEVTSTGESRRRSTGRSRP